MLSQLYVYSSKQFLLGQWGPGGPAVTSHSISSLCFEVTDGWLFIPGRVYVFEGCFFDLRLLRLLLLCIGVWPCRTVYVHMLK